MARDMLRFITCGSVDDGKSTLLGRLLFDTRSLATDQLSDLRRDSKRYAPGRADLDFALLVDGLAAEREQGITIDVAYRYFATEKRSFIAADTPGHEQYTRNMITGASTADLAIVLVDAQRGVLTQTRRHTTICALMGVRHLVLAVTKMDLLDFDAARFAAIDESYRAFAHQLGTTDIVSIPVCGPYGDNVASLSDRMSWYTGPTLLEALERAYVSATPQSGPLRMPVQIARRPDQNFRGYAGRIASGVLKPGDAVWVQPSGHEARIARIVTADGDLDVAQAGQSVTLTFGRELDCSREDVIAAAKAPCEVADQLQASLAWMADAPMLPGRAYWLKIGANTVTATVTEIKFKVNVDTFDRVAAKELALNEIARVNLSLSEPIAFDSYADNRETGGFILIDRVSNNTVGAGMIRFALRRANNIKWQAAEIGREAHASLKGQRAAILWFTGLSGAGKSTIANLVETKLHALGRHTLMLDGDNLRHGLNRDLGFTPADRVENVRRVAEVSRLAADAGLSLIALVALISPYRQERALARSLAPAGAFFEIFVDAPLAVAERRDPKGLYKKARAGLLANFTGIDSPYEAPEAPEIRINSETTNPEEAAEAILAAIAAKIAPG